MSKKEKKKKKWAANITTQTLTTLSMPVIQVGRANMTEVISHYNRSWDFNLDLLGFAVWPKKLVTTFVRFGIDHSSAGCVKSIS